MKKSKRLKLAINERKDYLDYINKEFGIILLREKTENIKEVSYGLLMTNKVVSEEDLNDIKINLSYKEEMIKNIEIWGW